MLSGDKATDVQHRFLVDVVNEIADVIDDGTAKTQLGQILPLLDMYVEWHFEREEKCMFRRSCPYAYANERAHESFMTVVKRFRVRYQAEGGSQAMAEEMYHFMCDWLVNHIIKIDSTMRDYPDRTEKPY